MKEEERIRCPVHDLIGFKKSEPDDALLWELIQTKPVQRLRRIKQLGFSEFVYPGATHTRFSHIVGAMQMARRMLSVLSKNQSFGDTEDVGLNKRATLAAALLHDIGHGPYSHVFEEICGYFGVDKLHEEYTKELLDSNEITSILDHYNVAQKTKQFFSREPGYSVFTSIISSQMDCDRLDFLCRDRHHTGIRSAAIDLEWLFDSLRIEETPIDDHSSAKAYSFVFTNKGLTVAEEFVIAYIKMYNNVYFHKTTRGVQHLVKDMLVDIIENHSDKPEINGMPLVNFFRGKQDLETYLALDDSSIVAVAHIAANSQWGVSSELARRFLCRDLCKCFELPPTETGSVPRAKLERFRSKLSEGKIPYIEDIVAQREYKQHDVTNSSFLKNILIKVGGEIESLGSVSSLVRTPARRSARIYFRTVEHRDRAAGLFDAC
jgi:hypothetical protein